MRQHEADSNIHINDTYMKTTSNVANIPIWRNTSLENLPNEIWKPVKDYEGLYEVSSLGRIKSIGRIVIRKQKNKENKNVFIKVKILRQFSVKGYLKINLSKNGSHITVFSHRLIALAFIENTLNKSQINHKNGIKNDNKINNLEWNTAQENTLHSFVNGLNRNIGHNHHNSKLSTDDYLEINKFLKQGKAISMIAKKYNLSKHTVYRIKNNTTWKYFEDNSSNN